MQLCLLRVTATWTGPTVSSRADFSGFPDFSPPEDEANEAFQCLCQPDLLDDLDFHTANP
ncbi:hypothetical protein E2C01_026633 [Portunus trituberculatus]|uniref:Uncharacterized protein n=1 Tax=Portunus trituberculatus TaxID=210409 RepID=A0A5B7EJE8_PORTR|nr:hypothetical protein [Portunus trituberculatus]